MQPRQKLFVLLGSALLVAVAVTHGAEYESVADIYDKIETIAAGAGGDASWSLLQNSGGSNIWTEGTPFSTNVYLLKITKGGTGSGRENVLVVGTQHAREWVAYRCVLDMAELVVDRRNDDTWPAGSQYDHFKKFKEMNIEKLTDNANIYVVPVANPTGYAYSKANDTEGMGQTGGWRKNRRDTSTDDQPAPGTRYTWGQNITPGVDLNRNWPTTDWGDDGTRPFPPPSGPNTQIETTRYRTDNGYCGRPNGNSWAAPFRPPVYEKEVAGLVNLSASMSFDCFIDVHSFSALVGWSENVDTANVNLRPDQGWDNDKQVMQLLGNKAAKLIKNPGSGTAYEAATGPYPVSGDALWYHYENTTNQALTFLIEVGQDTDGFRPTNATAHAEAVLPGQLFMMFSAVDKSFASKPTARFRKP